MMSTPKKTSPNLQQDIMLGQQTQYPSAYAPSLLFPIARADSRQSLREQLGLAEDAELFQGVDIWTAYEVSWLLPSGKPQVAIVEFSIPANSPNIIESKSFKLYLNSLNQAVFSHVDDLIQTLEKDLSEVAAAPVEVSVKSLAEYSAVGVVQLGGVCLDDEEVSIDCYSPNPYFLRVDDADSKGVVSETLYSDLLKTNCPVTGQPDWASVWIKYRGLPIDRKGLLKYIISFREHQDFHEQCVERMFTDIIQRCQPESLTVYARYTRRGGLDINPYRSSGSELPKSLRLVRQ